MNLLSFYDPQDQTLVFRRISQPTLFFNDFNNTLNTLLSLTLNNGFVQKTLNVHTDIRNAINQKPSAPSTKDYTFILLLTVIPVILSCFFLFLCRHCLNRHRQKKQLELDILKKQDNFEFGFDLLKKQLRIQQLKMEG